jgi:hypothetical protein
MCSTIYCIMHSMRSSVHCIAHQSDPEGFSYIPHYIVRAHTAKEPQCQCSMCLPQSFNAKAQYAALKAYVTIINIYFIYRSKDFSENSNITTTRGVSNCDQYILVPVRPSLTILNFCLSTVLKMKRFHRMQPYLQVRLVSLFHVTFNEQL